MTLFLHVRFILFFFFFFTICSYANLELGYLSDAFLFKIIFICERERKRKRYFHTLVHSPNGHDDQSPFDLNLEARGFH